jgi:hypothetical protein
VRQLTGSHLPPLSTPIPSPIFTPCHGLIRKLSADRVLNKHMLIMERDHETMPAENRPSGVWLYNGKLSRAVVSYSSAALPQSSVWHQSQRPALGPQPYDDKATVH